MSQLHELCAQRPPTMPVPRTAIFIVVSIVSSLRLAAMPGLAFWARPAGRGG